MPLDYTRILWLALAVMAMLLILRHLWARRPLWPQPPAALRWAMDFSHSVFFIVLVVTLFRSLLYEPFQIPSGSMRPTLHPGDYVLINKHAYNIRMPIVERNLIRRKKPRRGDVVVFYPPGSRRHFIKRVLGIPGDLITIKNNILHVNGQRLPQTAAAGPAPPGSGYFQETLDGRSHLLQLDLSRRNLLGLYGAYRVPEGRYFMLGDNRDNSADSRSCFGFGHCTEPPGRQIPYPHGWSLVPEANIVGRAAWRFMHWPSWGSLPRFDSAGAIH